MDSWSLLIEIVILLACCLAAGTALSWLKQSPLVGYLLAGMLLGGPGSFHVVRSEERIEAIAELGVALLLFSLGLEFSWRRLGSLGALTILAGVLQVGVTGAAAAGAAALFGLGIVQSVAVGAMLSLSSTAAVLRVLMDRGEIDSLHGRNSLAILLVQDVAVVPLAILMELLGGGGTPAKVAGDVAVILAVAAAMIGLLYLLLSQIVVRLLQVLNVEQNRELAILLAVVVGLGATWAAHAAGLSPAMGAFLAGLFLGASPFATQIRADIASLRVVLLTLFFGAVGMVADPVWIIHNLWFVLAIAAVIVAAKAAIVWGLLRIMRQPAGASLATGVCLGQIGEFAFVLGSAGLAGAVITEQTYRAVVSAAIATLILTPYLVFSAPRLAAWFERGFGRVSSRREKTAAADAQSLDLVIVGFGPAGEAVGRDISGKSLAVVVLDLNPAAPRRAAAMGLAGHVGDASQAEVLEHIHIERARLVVITLPSRSAALAVLANVRSLAPHAHVIVRSRYHLHLAEFQAGGAHETVDEEQQVGSALSERVRSFFDAESG